MIQFNLLPDVKLEYIKAQRARRLMLAVSIIVTLAAVGLLVLLLSVQQLQKKHIDDLSDDINASTSELKSKPQIGRILTVQNQLESLGGLHAVKPASSRLFQYLNSVTPVEVSISNFSVDFVAHKATITGSAQALSNVNKYVDTLKFTTYIDANKNSNKSFSNVVLTAFGLNQGQGASGSKPATYTIDFEYDPIIFDITNDVSLQVPKQVSTRSALETPNNLFQESQNDGGTQ